MLSDHVVSPIGAPTPLGRVFQSLPSRFRGLRRPGDRPRVTQGQYIHGLAFCKAKLERVGGWSALLPGQLELIGLLFAAEMFEEVGVDFRGDAASGVGANCSGRR